MLVKYPTKYDECLNTVLSQECIRYNSLITVMLSTLALSIKALKGLVVMSPELDSVCDAIFNNQVPEAWANTAYPSMKPLSAWVMDLTERIKFIQVTLPQPCNPSVSLPRTVFVTGRLE